MRRQREGGAGISREKKTSAIREELCLGGRIVAESTSTRIDSDPTNVSGRCSKGKSSTVLLHFDVLIASYYGIMTPQNIPLA